MGFEIKEPSDLEDIMQEAFSMREKLVFLDIFVDPSEHVYPMHVAPNGAMNDMWLSKSKRT